MKTSAAHLRIPQPRREQPHLTQLDSGSAYAYLQPQGGWCVSNAGVLIGEDSVTLIDCTATPASARQLLARIRERTQRPIARLVITHHHGDHHFGASAFPGATVIAHEHTREAVLRDGVDLPTIWPEANWGQITLTPPTLTFTDRTTLHTGGQQAELLHFGPAHTTGDVVVWLPERGILYTGDLTFSGVTPFVFMGSVRGSLQVLGKLKALGAERIVSGHGPIADARVIEENVEYLRWVQQLARDGATAGWEPLEAALRADLGPFSHWPEPERLVGNLHRAYAELGGLPLGHHLPVGAAVKDMVAFNGGKPMTCTI
ncbi:MBL fold metallo-hydrolase [Streptomyces sp. WAC 01529]|nr:MBL fold metallo-hydrolase [Streptomyces sp. WAC 01529]AZM56385.1 MBL fold metallo-hydrolase [Streptomyces sp. WAC 01529]